MSFATALFQRTLATHLLINELSLREAAKESGMSASTLSRLTSGELPDVETFAKIVTWLGCDANTFLGVEASERTATDQAWHDLSRALEMLGMPADLIEALVVVIRLVGKMREP